MTPLDQAVSELHDSDPEFAATLHLLGAPVLGDRAAEFVNVDRRRVRFVELLRASRGWSHGEKLLVKAALDMWNGDGKTPLGDLMYTLDDENLHRVLEAVEIRCWRRAPGRGAPTAGGVA